MSLREWKQDWANLVREGRESRAALAFRVAVLTVLAPLAAALVAYFAWRQRLAANPTQDDDHFYLYLYRTVYAGGVVAVASLAFLFAIPRSAGWTRNLAGWVAFVAIPAALLLMAAVGKFTHKM